MPRKAEYSSPIFICCFRYRTVAPNGIRASFASLKHCLPKGIPMIVTHSTAPSTAASTSHGNPTKNQPKNITDDGNRASSKFNLLAKWKKCKLRKLEALLPNGDTNDRDAPEHTSSHPAETVTARQAEPRTYSRQRPLAAPFSNIANAKCQTA